MEKKHVKIQIYGLVHGVFFRDTTRRVAKNKKLTGFVKNMPDGSVLIEAEGPEDRLNELIAFAKIGPKWAKVERFEYEFSNNLQNYTKFKFAF